MVKIVGIYQGTREIIDTFDTKEEAEKMLSEYKMAYGTDWYLYVEI